MGREVKRVALDFNWPIEKVWDGFLNPHYKKCPLCHAGYSASYDIVSKHINGLMWDRAARNNADVAAITTFLGGRPPSRSVFGHDSLDAWAAVKKLGKLAGLPDGWGTCAHCGGDGVDPANKAAYDAWEPTEPPEGEGYQIWETVSEGSPISPVFATPEELARYMAGKRWGADDGSSYETWLKFITGPGWAPSMVMDAKGIHTGPEAAL
jgi:hypothetical protein